MMGRDPGCSMNTLYEQCESQLWWRISVELSRAQRDVEKLYEAG